MKKTLLAIFMSLSASNAMAGLHSLTIHSRANCANNESITWYAAKSLDLLTATRHVKYKNGKISIDQRFDTGWEHTWRSAAVCWGEGIKFNQDWEVWGQHYMKNPKSGKVVYLGGTHVVDCDIYTGWWD